MLGHQRNARDGLRITSVDIGIVGEHIAGCVGPGGPIGVTTGFTCAGRINRGHRASLAPWMVMVTWAVLVSPPASRMVYVNTSVRVWLLVRSAWTDGCCVHGVGVGTIGGNLQRTVDPRYG